MARAIAGCWTSTSLADGVLVDPAMGSTAAAEGAAGADPIQPK